MITTDLQHTRTVLDQIETASDPLIAEKLAHDLVVFLDRVTDAGYVEGSAMEARLGDEARERASRYRVALTGIIGVSTPKELEAMRAVLMLAPPEDTAPIIAAIDLLLEETPSC